MKSVWVIEQGSYSDYRVVGVFSSRKNAQLVMGKITNSYDTPSIAQWDIDPCVERINAGLTNWIVTMLRDGTLERCEATGFSAYHLSDALNIWRRATAPAYKGKGIEDCLNGTVWAKNQKHAVKIANEIRTQLIATNKWK